MDQALANFAQTWQAEVNLPLGTSNKKIEIQSTRSDILSSSNTVKLAVVGAHLNGMPLNFQLTTRGGTLLEKTKLAAHYKLFALKTPRHQNRAYNE